MKFLLAILLMFMSLLSYSQIRLNLLAGGNTSSFSKNLLNDYGFEEYRQAYLENGGRTASEVNESNSKWPFFSIETDFFLKNTIFIKTGLKLSLTGNVYSFETNDFKTEGTFGKEKTPKFKMQPNLTYLSIPLNIGKQFKNKLCIYGGFSHHILIENSIGLNSYREKFDPSTNKAKWEENWDYDDNEIAARKNLVFVDAGITVLDLFGQEGFVFDFQIKRCIMSAYSDSRLINSNSDINEAKLWSIDVGFGASLFLKKD